MSVAGSRLELSHRRPWWNLGEHLRGSPIPPSDIVIALHCHSFTTSAKGRTGSIRLVLAAGLALHINDLALGQMIRFGLLRSQ